MLDHQLLHKLLQAQRYTMCVSKALMARRLAVVENTIARWISQFPSTALEDADRMFDELELGRVVARQPFDPELSLVGSLAAAREAMGLTLRDVSSITNIPIQTLSRWEVGHGRGPTMARLNLWCTLLGLGGLRVSLPPRTGVGYPLEYEPDPSPDQVKQMLATETYEAHRYIPFSVEYALNRVRAYRIGITDRHFWTELRAPNGESLNLAKYRPVWTKLALKYGCPEKSANRLQAELVNRDAVRYTDKLRREVEQMRANAHASGANTLDK